MISPGRTALLAFALFAALVGLELWRLASPAPAPASAPEAAFSADRAIAALHAVSIDAPHALATPAHDVVRDRVVAALRALDYGVEVQHTFACNAAAMCGAVDNVIARLPGAEAGAPAVVVAAHYDSVAAGPGASDDGTGVASVLEIARAIRHDRFANPVVFMLDDGEESGLLGAEGFVADAARAKSAAFVINLEARGTTGAPFLFETSREQRWILPIVARALPHPVTTSMFATIYDLLPNDTDLTVFKRAGRAGINFAYLGGGTQYHTPLDDFAHVDAGVVQWRGEQALAMVRAFAATPLGGAAPGGAVWFDVFATFIVWWPTGWTPILCAIALVLLGVAIVRGRGREDLTLGGVALGVGSLVGALALAGVLGTGLGKLLALRAPGALFEPHPGPMIAAAWLVGIAAAIAVGGLARRRASFAAVFAGHAIAWNLLALAVAVLLPGAAYLLAVPGVAMAVLAVATPALRARAPIAGLGALVAAAVVVLPFVLLGYDELGAAVVPATAVMVGLMATTFAPLVAETSRRLVAGSLAAAGVLAVIALVLPTQSAEHPYQLSLAHVTDADTGAARWQANDPTPVVSAAGQFGAIQPVAPWFGASGIASVAPAPAIGLPPPTIVITPGALAADGTRPVTLDIASVRGAPRLAISYRSEAATVAIRVNGVALPPRPARFYTPVVAGWTRILIRGSAAHVELTMRGAGASEGRASDSSFGLPAAGAAIATVRDVTGSVPVQDGDVTVIERRISW